MPSIKHFHTYERMKGNKDVFRCIHSECSHIQRKEMLLGKKATCPICESKFLLTAQDLHQKAARRPRCIMCSGSKKAQDFRKRKDEIEKSILDMVGEF